MRALQAALVAGAVTIVIAGIHAMPASPQRKADAATAKVERVTASAVLLDLPHIRQETRLCVPTSAAMVLKFYGDPQHPRRLKALSRGRDWQDGQQFNDFTVTKSRDLVRGLDAIGYRWTEENFDNDGFGFNGGMRAIDRSLSDGRPVIVDTSIGIGHTMVVVGRNFDAETITLVDPDLSAPGRVTISLAEFERIWNSNKVKFDRRAAVFTRPK